MADVTRARPANPPSVNLGVAALALAVIGWGLTWPANKLLLESLSPFWMAALRSAVATAALLLISLPGGRLSLPPRADLPVLLSITLLHMVGFSVLAAIGLQLVPVGRSVVLAYTTPLWVTPGAALLLGERPSPRRVAGVGLGLLGLGVLFNPFAFDWGDRTSVVGHAALLLAALLWAANILHVRGHAWQSTPFQLVPWEMLLATAIILAIALVSGPPPAVEWDARLLGLLLGTSIVGLAIPHWAVATAGRSLPAVTVSLGLLAAPLIGITAATLALGEAPDPAVWLAIACVLGGVALGAAGRGSRREPEPAHPEPLTH
jgi:drug/metabolite transporter (DMT)-like permease